jgi:hypothetical protein
MECQFYLACGGQTIIASKAEISLSQRHRHNSHQPFHGHYAPWFGASLTLTAQVPVNQIYNFRSFLMAYIIEMSEISGSYGGEYKDGCLLGCCAIALMMESASTSETSVNFYQTTRRNNPEDSHLHHRDNYSTI